MTIMFLCVLQSSARGTVKASANFQMADDVSVLRKAMEGMGTFIQKYYT